MSGYFQSLTYRQVFRDIIRTRIEYIFNIGVEMDVLNPIITVTLKTLRVSTNRMYVSNIDQLSNIIFTLDNL